MENLSFLIDGVKALFTGDGWKYIVMWAIGGLLIFLA
jgi:hypothetical protein